MGAADYSAAHMDTPTLPPMAELFTKVQLVERHSRLLTNSRLAWALRNRTQNGLTDAHAVFDSPCGELLIHEPAFVAWFVGLAGRAKPRAARRAAAAP